jgi:hypothetical protein
LRSPPRNHSDLKGRRIPPGQPRFASHPAIYRFISLAATFSPRSSGRYRRPGSLAKAGSLASDRLGAWLDGHEQQMRGMCGRPPERKKNLLVRYSAQSGADMCAASGTAHMPRAWMGVRGSGPIQCHALEAPCHGLVFPIPSHRLMRHTSPLTFLHPQQPRRRERLCGRDWSLINPTLGHQGPDDASHLVGQRHPDQHWRLAGQHAGDPRACRNPVAGRPA